MTARIYQPSPSAMQAGPPKNRKWVLEYEPAAAKSVDPLMGWTGSADMLSQVRMKFDTAEAAVAYATRNGIDHMVKS